MNLGSTFLWGSVWRAPHCSAIHCSAFHCSTVPFTVVHLGVVHFAVVYFNIVNFTAVHFSTLYNNTFHYTCTANNLIVFFSPAWYFGAVLLKYIENHFNEMWYTVKLNISFCVLLCIKLYCIPQCSELLTCRAVNVLVSLLGEYCTPNILSDVFKPNGQGIKGTK